MRQQALEADQIIILMEGHLSPDNFASLIVERATEAVGVRIIFQH